MNKEKQTKEYERCKQLIDELSKMPPMIIETAYIYAINRSLYGEDVTEKWVTAVQNATALETAYRKGYYDAMKRINSLSEKLSRCYESVENDNDKGGIKHEKYNR